MEPFTSYLLVGIVIVLIGIIGIARGSKKKGRCTASASAVIVEIEKDTESDGDNTKKEYTYTPIYEFTVNGTTVRKSGGIYTHDKKKYSVGDSATVKYNPDDPKEFLVNGKNSGKGFSIALILFGLLIVAVSFTQK